MCVPLLSYLWLDRATHPGNEFTEEWCGCIDFLSPPPSVSLLPHNHIPPKGNLIWACTSTCRWGVIVGWTCPASLPMNSQEVSGSGSHMEVNKLSPYGLALDFWPLQRAHVWMMATTTSTYPWCEFTATQLLLGGFTHTSMDAYCGVYLGIVLCVPGRPVFEPLL